MKLRNFFRKIFSIDNNERHIVIHLLGLKISINTARWKWKFLKRRMKKSKIVKNKIVFTNFTDGSYGCNPKYIAEEILRQKLPYELVWLVKDPEKERVNFPNAIRLVESASPKALVEFATAKVWISNVRLNNYIERGLFKKPGQSYLQTWHGSKGPVKVEGDIVGNREYDNYKNLAREDSSLMDFLIAPSDWDREVLKNCFWFKGEYICSGYPRDDLFFLEKDKRKEKIASIRSKLRIGNNKKILLYTPTHRDCNGLDVINIDFTKVLESLQKKFGGDFILLIRAHPNTVKSEKNIFSRYPMAMDVSSYPDVQELLLAADILITDYSSTMFDFMFSKKPLFIYANDMEEYARVRGGFIMDMKKLPFPLATSNEELIKNIETFDLSSYVENIDRFIESRNYYDDGNASKICVELIREIIEHNYVANKIAETDLELQAYSYLKKYLYVLEEPEIKVANSTNSGEEWKNERILWQMWWQGIENAPSIVKACMNSVEKFYPSNRIIITEKNYGDYVDLPDYILEKHKSGIISNTHLSDIIRIFLLQKYGGVWLDATCLLTESIPENIMNSEVFFFRSISWSQYPKVPTKKMMRTLVETPFYRGEVIPISNWFIISKPNNNMITNVKKFLLEYWHFENYAINYFFFHLFINLALMNDKTSKELYENMPNLSNVNPHILQGQLYNIFDGELFEEIKSYSFVHKLTYAKFKNIPKGRKNFYNYILENYGS